MEEEEVWIREKEPLACSTDFGRDRNTVMQLQQKHQALEAEVQGTYAYHTMCLRSCVEMVGGDDEED